MRSSVGFTCDRLGRRSSVFNELFLMVSLSNHGPHRFSAGPRDNAVIETLIQLLVEHSFEDGNKSGKTEERPGLDLT